MIENETFNNDTSATDVTKEAKVNEKAVDDEEIVEIKTDDENRENNVEAQVSHKEGDNFDNTDDSSSSESSESDCELASNSSARKTHKKDLSAFHGKTEKKRPGFDAVKAAIEGNCWKRNNIFEEPSKSVPLPRKMGTINVTFSERRFPTPARESSHVEEQEVLSLSPVLFSCRN